MIIKYFILFFVTFNPFVYSNAFSNYNIKNILLKNHNKNNDNNNFSYICSKWDGSKFNSLILEGGGVRAVVYAGALKKLSEENILKNIKYIAGTSSGAQTAAFLAAGFNYEEITNVLRFAPWNKIFDGGFFSIKGLFYLINKFGFYNPKYLENYIDDLLFLKTGIKNITFLELFNLSNIHLKIGVCTLKFQEFKYIDHISYPNMPVSKGLLASSSIPLLFTATEWNNELFIDGGLIGNLPITAFPDSKCLALQLCSDNEFNYIEKENPKNLLTFLRIILNILFKFAKDNYSPKNKFIKNIDYIQIYTGSIGVLDTNMTNKTIDNLVNYGYQAVDEFLSNCT